MRLEDLQAVMEIGAKSFLHPWSLDALLAELNNPRALHVVARLAAEDRLAGFALAWLVVDEMHINSIAVHPEERRHGVARLLLEDLVRRALKAGVVEAWLEVRRSNLAAIGLYESYGFITRGVRPRYYSDTGEDALMMSAALNADG